MPFDGIEFDEDLRWIDVMNDLSFLTMDLKVHGRADLAFAVLDTYLQQTGDYEGVRLLRLYEVYRALVRALVLSLSPQAEVKTDLAPRLEDYLHFATQSTQATLQRPCLVLMHGLSGSGKSTVARALATTLPGIRARSDVERKRLLGRGAIASPEANRKNLYSKEATALTMQRLRVCAELALKSGWSFIADATFLRYADREGFHELARQNDAICAIVHCETDEASLRERLCARAESRQDASDATIQVLELQMRTAESLTDEERCRTHVVSTNGQLTPSVLASLNCAIRSQAVPA